jgi:hypothetical protein
MNTERLISADAATQIAADTIREHTIRGMRPFNISRGGSLNLEFKRAWAVTCDLAIRFSSGERRAVHGRRGEVSHVWIQRPIVEVCWSSTGRTVAAATAALALYREVTELAALVESRLAEETIGFRAEGTSESSTDEVAR